MREHMGIFRGKRTDNGEWVEGFFHYSDWVMPPTMEFVKRDYFILPLRSGDAYQIDPSTVGEATGMTDKNGRMVFEYDIIRCGSDVAWVAYLPDRPTFAAMCSKPDSAFLPFDPGRCEVIGNLFDNPGLIGGKDIG